MVLRWTPAERHLLMRNMIDLAERRGFYANEHEWAAQLTELHDAIFNRTQNKIRIVAKLQIRIWRYPENAPKSLDRHHEQIVRFIAAVPAIEQQMSDFHKTLVIPDRWSGDVLRAWHGRKQRTLSYPQRRLRELQQHDSDALQISNQLMNIQI